MTEKEKILRLARVAVLLLLANALAFFLVAMLALTTARAETLSVTLIPEGTCNPLFPRVCGLPDKTYTITKDTGGVIGVYLDRYKLLRHIHIVVDGLCNSACTLFLANPDVCVTEKAFFGFHVASSEAGTAILMATYPDHVKKWIAARGGLTTKVLFARGEELAPKCKP